MKISRIIKSKNKRSNVLVRIDMQRRIGAMRLHNVSASFLIGTRPCFPLRRNLPVAAVEGLYAPERTPNRRSVTRKYWLIARNGASDINNSTTPWIYSLSLRAGEP